MKLQWNVIEKVSEEIENAKPVIQVKLWHNPDYRLVVETISDEKVEKNKVFLGDFDKFDQKEDKRFKRRYEALKEKYHVLQFNHEASKKAIEKMKDFLKWL